MISIWFRYDFVMILIWQILWFFMVLGCLYFSDMISIWFFYDFGVPSHFWYDFAMVLGRYLLVGLGCFAVSSAGSCLRMGMEAIRRNTGRLEGETFLLGHCLANDISDSKLWLRKKLPDRSWTKFHPCMKSGSDRAVQQTRIPFRSEKEKHSQSLHAISEPLTGDQKNESLSPFATTVYGFMAETLALILSMFLEFDYFTTFRICIE